MRSVLLVATTHTSRWLNRLRSLGTTMVTLNRPDRSLLTRARTGGCSVVSASAATIVMTIRSRGVQLVPVTTIDVPTVPAVGEIAMLARMAGCVGLTTGVGVRVGRVVMKGVEVGVRVGVGVDVSVGS